MIMNNLMLLPKSIQGFCFCMGIFSWNEMNSTMHFFNKSPFVSHFIIFISSINSFPILYLFSLTRRYPNNEYENDSANSLGLDFKRVIYAGEFSNNEDMEDCKTLVFVKSYMASKVEV